MGKKIAIIGITICLIVILFFTIIIGSVATALNQIIQINKNTDSFEMIACEITGTKNGKDLNLKLTYDSITVKGITGTVSDSGKNFSASTKNSSSNNKTKLQLPSSGADLDVQTFMEYKAVTAKNSDQYKLLNSSDAEDDGIYRKVNGYYAVALGSYYGSKMGTKYIITFKQSDGSTKTIKAILGDQKSDKHTDSKHQYHTVDKSVVEFITAKGTTKNIKSTQSQINKDFGVLTGIYRMGGNNVKLKGEIDGKNVSVTGTVDGVELAANGTLEDNKLFAEGFIGTAENGVIGSYNGGAFAWPTPGVTLITSDYDWRWCRFHGREFHSGIDIGAGMGKPIVAAASGEVILSSYYGSYGYAVIISHGSALYSLYGHCSKLLVKTGQNVKKGQIIANVGSTGNSTGPHLHFEVRKGANSYSNHVSPWNYLKRP